MEREDERREWWVKEIAAPAVRRLKPLPYDVGPINVLQNAPAQKDHPPLL